MHTGRRLQAALVVCLVAMMVVALVSPVQGKPAKKTYTVDVTDISAGHADTRLAITVTNTAPNQRLGSVNVRVPDVFVVVDAPDDTDPTTRQVLELRDLDIVPGSSRTFVIEVDVRACASGTTEAFEVQAKQSNRFKGEGNDFVLDTARSNLTVEIDTACSLVFVDQPADAERNASITSAEFDAQGAPITVEIRDADERPVAVTTTVTLTARNADVATEPIAPGGTTSVTAVDGVATFDPGPTLATSAFDYTLVAEADFDADDTVDARATSDTFDIVDEAVTCAAGRGCRASVEREGPQGRQRLTAAFRAGPTEVTLAVGLGAADVPDFSCEETPGELLAGQFFTIGDGDAASRVGRVSYLIPNASRPVSQYEICWAAPYEFAAEGGTSTVHGTKPDGPATLHVGILRDCEEKRYWHRHKKRERDPGRPCVSRRTLNKHRSEVTVVIKVDSRDPWMRH